MRGAARGRAGSAEVGDERWGRRHGQEAEEQERGQVKVATPTYSSPSLRRLPRAADSSGERRCGVAESGPAGASRPRRRRRAGGARRARPGGPWPGGGGVAEGPVVPLARGNGSSCVCGPSRWRRPDKRVAGGGWVSRGRRCGGGGWRSLRPAVAGEVWPSALERLRCCHRRCAASETRFPQPGPGSREGCRGTGQ